MLVDRNNKVVKTNLCLSALTTKSGKNIYTPSQAAG